MRAYRLSQDALADISGISEYTREEWGAAQAQKYTTGLREVFGLIGSNPLMGRSCDELQPGLRRHEHGRHVVFYLPQEEFVIIVRVLHQREMPEASAFVN